MGEREVALNGKNRIMIYGYFLDEFRTATDEVLAISIPRTETAAVSRHFQERMPYGLFVPEVP